MMSARSRVPSPVPSVTHSSAPLCSAESVLSVTGTLRRSRTSAGPIATPGDTPIQAVDTRYGRIALNEGAPLGYARGVAELAWSLWRQPRRPMSRELWDRFTGVAHARASLARDARIKPGTRAMIAHEGKHARLIERALVELGAILTDPSEDPEVVVVGTLSPGPMLDAQEALHDESRPVIVPWELPNASEKGERESSTIAA